jgi:hypothetical protein
MCFGFVPKRKLSLKDCLINFTLNIFLNANRFLLFLDTFKFSSGIFGSGEEDFRILGLVLMIEFFINHREFEFGDF